MNCRVLMLIASVLAATPAWAQTPEVPSRAPHAKVVSKTVVSKPAARKVKPHHTVPIVAPRHGVTPRKPGHKAARLITQAAPPKPGAAKGGPAKAAVRPAGPAKPAIPADQGTVTGLHLPRYASLKTDDVNMRSGPGSRYPVLWTYKRRELPVRIEREFDVWRLVEDMDGIRGWVHQATLTGRRTFVITGTAPRTLRAEGADTAAAVAVLKPGVVGRVRGCAAGAPWCEVQVGEYRGWLARADFWGTDAGETVIP